MAGKKSSTKSSTKKSTVGTATVKSKPENVTDSEAVKTLADAPQYLASTYSPKAWVNGETIYDTDLNHIEQGIASAEDDISSLEAIIEGLGGGAYYGTCSTASGTTAKVVACPDLKELVAGVAVFVYFSECSNVSLPTLNVNSTGAKNIYTNGATVSAYNIFQWAAGTSILFVYDGTYWVPTGVRDNYYGECSTAASTARKIADISEFVLTKGARVTIYFPNGNTTKSTLLLQISGLSSCAVIGNTAWNEGDYVTFVFDGSYEENFIVQSVGADAPIEKITVNGTEQEIVDKTVDISVPTKVSELENDSGYITDAALDGYAKAEDVEAVRETAETANETANTAIERAEAAQDAIPTKVSELENDVPYGTESDVKQAVDMSNEAYNCAAQAQYVADAAKEKAEAVEDAALTGVNVNGTEAPVNNHVAEITVEGGNGNITYGTCDSDADDEKAVTADGFELVDGAFLAVRFSKGNTWADPDMRLNGGNIREVIGDARCSENGVVFFVYNSADRCFYVDAGLTRANEVKDSAITAIKVNGADVPVENNKAEFTVSGSTPTYDADSETLIF